MTRDDAAAALAEAHRDLATALAVEARVKVQAWKDASTRGWRSMKEAEIAVDADTLHHRVEVIKARGEVAARTVEWERLR